MGTWVIPGKKAGMSSWNCWIGVLGRLLPCLIPNLGNQLTASWDPGYQGNTGILRCTNSAWAQTLSTIPGLSQLSLLLCYSAHLPHPHVLFLFSRTLHSNRMGRTLVCLKMDILSLNPFWKWSARVAIIKLPHHLGPPFEPLFCFFFFFKEKCILYSQLVDLSDFWPGVTFLHGLGDPAVYQWNNTCKALTWWMAHCGLC